MPVTDEIVTPIAILENEVCLEVGISQDSPFEVAIIAFVIG